MGGFGMKRATRRLNNSDQGNIIYLPLEVCKRELVGKIFLATYLAKQGHTVVLFPSDFFDRYGWPASGIYIGKNCFRTEVPYDTHYYGEMKKSGISVWYLDEEGGVYAGQDVNDWRKRLELRLDTKTLGKTDKILCWGTWQAQMFQEQEPDAEVLVVGSPNFDVFDRKYQEAFSSYDLEQTGGEQNYILVNTRFSLTNGFVNLTDHLTGVGPTSKLIDSYHFAETTLTMGALQYMISKLTLRLARAYPKKRFIVRPHPAEDPSFYIAAFHKMENISVRWSGDVGSWIRMSSVLIHNGCTTAIQASLAQKPVITYIPLDEPKEVEMKLPNSIGKICHNDEDVIDVLENLQTLILPNEFITETIDGTQSIERISDLLIRSNVKTCDQSRRKNILRFIQRSQKLNIGKRALRKIVTHFNRPMRERVKREEAKFDFKFFEEAIDIHAAANRAFGVSTKIIEYKKSCYVILPSDTAG
jgi:surface carbohydrate biosynthesis protein